MKNKINKYKEFSNIFETQEPVKEQYMFCKNEGVDIDIIANEIKEQFDISLKSENKKAVNGALIAQIIREGGTCWCGQDILPSKLHSCVILFLYQDTNSKGKVKIRKKIMTTETKRELEAFFKNNSFKLINKKEG